MQTLLSFPGAGGGGHSYKYGLNGNVLLYRVWVLTSLSETGYLIISLYSMYFRVRILNLQRLTYHRVRSLGAKYRPDHYRRDKSVKFGTELP